MRLIRRSWDRYSTKDNEYTVTRSKGRIEGLYPKYYISKNKGCSKGKYASTLKEAQEIINNWKEE